MKIEGNARLPGRAQAFRLVTARARDSLFWCFYTVCVPKTLSALMGWQNRLS